MADMKQRGDRGQSPDATDMPHPRKGRESLGHYREVKTGREVSQRIPEGKEFQQTGEDLPQRGKPYEQMTRPELVEIARANDIEVDEAISREQLVTILSEHPDLSGEGAPLPPAPRGRVTDVEPKRRPRRH